MGAATWTCAVHGAALLALTLTTIVLCVCVCDSAPARMILALPRANVTEENPYVRFITDNNEVILAEAVEAMMARFHAGRRAVDRAQLTLLMVRTTAARRDAVSRTRRPPVLAK